MRYLFIALVLAGCTSARHASYERLSREANPGLLRLRAPVGLILGNDHHSAREVVVACREADAELRELRYALYRDDAIRDQHDPFAIEVTMTLSRWRHYCRRRATALEWQDDCAHECASRWKELAEDIEQLRGEAADEGVHLESLLP